MRPWLLASAIALLAAIPPIWPYAFYTLFRVLICGVAIGATVILRSSRPGLVAPFVLIALLFNPVVPVHLTKALWAIIDLVVAAFFYYSAGQPPLIKEESEDTHG